MEIIADLHIHGRFSRGTSKDLTLANLEKWARIKGVGLLGTGDFTHPKWLSEIKDNLSDDGSGILMSKTGFPFVLQTEISLIYSDGGKGRRIHNIVLAPNLDVVEQINEALGKRGRLDYDGRPIFGISCPEFVELLMSISKDIEVIPAHCWTPWFSLFGSNSGYNSIKECFKTMVENIHAIETGLSSDPAMNWRLSQLDGYKIVSFSDCHSFWPWRIGREATVFELRELNYNNLIEALRSNTANKILKTIEFWPEEGKYHYDGHRNCNVCLSPPESIKLRGICPVCRSKLTIGVANRVNELADREIGARRADANDFVNIIPLSELIAGATGVGISTSKVWGVYNKLIEKFGNEFNVLFNAKKDELAGVVDDNLVNLIMLNRAGKIKVEPGYDGVYGMPMFSFLFSQIHSKTSAQKIIKRQKTLGEF